MNLVPAFPLIGEPGQWDALSLLAGTIFLEAEGEPVEGKVGVAWVIRNRMDARKLTLAQVILGPEGKAWGDGRAFEPFSCWNDDYQARALARLATAETSVTIADCWRAAAGVLWRLIPDPTCGATAYLNVEATRKLRGGTLPAWFDPNRVTCTIGRHTFLALG